jgi:hypothetical protein
MGVDFAGGVVIETRALAPVDQAALRNKLGGLGLGQVQIQEFGSPNDVLGRFEHPHGASAEQQAAIAKVRDSVQQALPGSDIRRVEVVGDRWQRATPRRPVGVGLGRRGHVHLHRRSGSNGRCGGRDSDHVLGSDQDGRLLCRDGVPSST